MLNTIIIEDEMITREKLAYSLNRISAEINIVATPSSVRESIECFRSNISADIVFCDVQLPDGISFEIFHKTEVRVPVIFITGAAHFMMDAFENNGIDYLLKPVEERELGKALQKYKMLQNHFANKTVRFDNIISYSRAKKRTRLVVKKGPENIPMRLEKIALFYSENRIVYAIDEAGKKYMAEGNLATLEHELDENIFFRANRQYIINVNYVKSFRAYERVKLKINMIPGELNERYYIVISQETAPAFRKWIYEA